MRFAAPCPEVSVIRRAASADAEAVAAIRIAHRDYFQRWELSSDDPEFLYLYGRALLLTDRQQDAAAAFDRAIQKINENMTPRNGELKIDARLAKIAAHLRAGDEQAARAAADDFAEVVRSQPSQANANTQPSPGVSP